MVYSVLRDAAVAIDTIRHYSATFELSATGCRIDKAVNGGLRLSE